MRLLFIIFLSLLSLTLSAQSFGLKTGAAMTNFSGDDAGDVDSRTGFYFGSFMKLGEANIRYSPEIIFHQKGAVMLSSVDSIADNEIKMSYVDIAFNGNFHINDELALVVGPYFAYAVSGSTSNDDWDTYNKTEFGANIGATYEVNDLFHVDLRYGLAFTDIIQAQTIKNRSIQIGIGYVFAY
jgi:hypothetical protein